MTEVTIGEGTRVYLNFSVGLEDGSEVDTNFGGDPVEFVVGDGSLLPGFERLLFGMEGGERQMFTVMPENAFGQPNDNNLQFLPRDQFDEDVELEIGLVFYFADASGGEHLSFGKMAPAAVEPDPVAVLADSNPASRVDDVVQDAERAHSGGMVPADSPGAVRAESQEAAFEICAAECFSPFPA